MPSWPLVDNIKQSEIVTVDIGITSSIVFVLLKNPIFTALLTQNPVCQDQDWVESSDFIFGDNVRSRL
jgi:hypothetical protein